MLQVFALVVAFSAAYEAIYNFILWGASYSVACAKAIANQVPCSPDNLSTLHPTPWNMLFATKAFATLFVVSSYSAYFRRFASPRSI